MEDKKIVLQKIPLDVFISLLTSIYEQGVDYIDLIGQKTEEADNIGIAIQNDYINKDVNPNDIKFPEINFSLTKEDGEEREYREEDDDDEFTSHHLSTEENSKLSDEDINDLI